MRRKFKYYIKRLLKIMKKPELKVLPGHLSFFILLSLVPTISLFGVICSQFSVSLTGIFENVSKALPEQVMEIIYSSFESPTFGVGISLVIGFFLASNGTSAIIVASNMLFKIDNDSYIRRRIKAFFMLLVLIILFMFIMLVMNYGSTILNFLYDYIFDVEMPIYVAYSFLVCKWSIGLFIVYFLLKLILTMAPNAPIPSKYMNQGALFTTVIWLLSSFAYTIYVTNFANYNMFYSTLANIVVLMIWVNILSSAMVIGIAINSDRYLRDNE